MKVGLIFIFGISVHCAFPQSYPLFGPEHPVTINNITVDAMEPYISQDGNTLFFNSLNSGGNTNLYYATRIDDTTFNFVGLVGGCYDPTPNHLDGCSSMDSIGNFFWVSLRDYPNQMDNAHRGTYSGGNVSSLTRVHGDFNIPTFGWIIMDGAVSWQGDKYYYCNAYFDFINNSCGTGVPCDARLGVAQRVNDSTFNKLPNTDGIFMNVNDTNYIVYAPQVTKDGLELYFTRLLKNSFNTEICVAVRNSPTDTFSLPLVIYSQPGFVPEAASPTTNKQMIYYHKKNGSGVFRIYLRYRTGTTSGMEEQGEGRPLVVFPSLTDDLISVVLPFPNDHFTLDLYSSAGTWIRRSNGTTMYLADLACGIYLLVLEQNGKRWSRRVVKY